MQSKLNLAIWSLKISFIMGPLGAGVLALIECSFKLNCNIVAGCLSYLI